MTSSLGFYVKPKVLHSPSFEDDDDLFGNDEEDQDIENAEYLQEVPYTSSSVDRSSIGSIPWADDAIKLNQVEWEKVEQMLAGLEALPTEDDLRNEILDWQKKFPQLIGQKGTYNMKATISNTLDMESLPSLNLSSDEGDLEMDDKITLRDRTDKRSSIEESVTPTPPPRKSLEGDTNLCDMLQNFSLTSVPLKFSQRDTAKKPLNKRKCASSSSSYSLHSPPTPVNVPIAQPITQQRLRMPPILNVLESTRKFRSLGRHNINPSFVQLTQVQQAKSAVVTQDQKSRSRFHTGHRSAWHVPLAANRFFNNNRNSIILPAISSRQQVLHQYNSQPTTISTSSEVGTTNTTPSSTRGHLLTKNINSFTHNPMIAKRDMLNGFSTTASTQTNTSGTSGRTGRSISAAVQYPRATFNALYLPYSVSKFNAFK